MATTAVAMNRGVDCVQRQRIWVTAALVAAGITGTLVYQGQAEPVHDAPRKASGSGPVEAGTRSVRLKASADGADATLGRLDTEPFSMLGVTWTDPGARITGRVEVRTRAVESGRWSPWVRLDGDSGQGDNGAARGGTEPAWFGPSDGVEARVNAGGGRTSAGLPRGLRLDMVDPGTGKAGSAMEPAAFSVEETGEPLPSTGEPEAPQPGVSTEPAASPSQEPSTEPPVSPSPTATVSVTPSPPATVSPSPAPSASASASASATSNPIPPAPPSTAPRPPITTRAAWGADESISPEAPGYLPGGKIKAVVVHHTAESNAYTCAQGPALVRGIYAYHVKQLGWKDVGYNFLVDRCGSIYEGRKGGADQPVMGAHAYGFNAETTGISVLGTYTDTAPPQAAMVSVARLAAWKLGQYGIDPAGTATLTAGDAGTNYFRKNWGKGAQLTLPAIHGHRDGYNTQCPGDAFYGQLATIRTWAAGSVSGLSIKAVTGAGAAGGKYYTKGAVGVTWTTTTPAALITKHELLVDGKAVSASPGTAASAKATLTTGTHTVAVRGTHLSGKTSTSPPVTVVAETTSPTFTTKPALALRTGTVNTTAVPVTLSWKAADNAALKEVRLSAPTAKVYGPATTSAAQTAKSGVATAWNLSAHDQAANTGTASVTGTPVILQETSGTRSGTWLAKSSASYLGGKSSTNSTKNASMSWTFTGRSAAWIVSRATTSGQAHIYVDGVKTTTADLRSTTTKYRDAIWTKTWSTSAKHTVKIVVVGTSGRPAVTTDGLIYLK